MALLGAVVFWGLAGCKGAEPIALEPGYASGIATLQLPSKGKFRIDFKPGSGWEGFSPLEGETSRFQNQLWLLPKRILGQTEDEITQQAMKDAQQQGRQTDLMAVRLLMKTVKLDISADAKTLTVVEPPANDPEKHPLAAAKFGGSL